MKFNDEHLISFLEKSTSNFYVFPENEDISHVEIKAIVKVLNPPTINNRGQYNFDIKTIVSNFFQIPNQPILRY